MKEAKILSIAIALYLSCLGCSKNKSLNEMEKALDEREFITEKTALFIKNDGSLKLQVFGRYVEANFNDEIVSEKGFVYGQTQHPEVKDQNFINILHKTNDNLVLGEIPDFLIGQTYYIRGYFKMSDGSYFYGNEIEVNISQDDYEKTKDSRSISLIVNKKKEKLNQTWITVKLHISEIKVESPKNIGVLYSANCDFSEEKIVLNEYYTEYDINNKTYDVIIENLTPGKTYYIKPYAIYKDGTISNGGISKVVITTLEK